MPLLNVFFYIVKQVSTQTKSTEQEGFIDLKIPESIAIKLFELTSFVTQDKDN